MNIRTLYVNESQWEFIRAALDALMKDHIQLHSDDRPSDWERKGYLKPMLNEMNRTPFKFFNSACPTAWKPLCFGQCIDSKGGEGAPPCFLCVWRGACHNDRYLKDRIDDADTLIKQAEDLIRDYPEDVAMRLSLEGMRAHRQELVSKREVQ